ncbi:MAG TPA: 3-hydroxyacyl-ACP dehydratase FabZ family protein, partial [Candidatus Binatia bacterium]|nr:3-hydroxyacyl-ACP dehydratase FabZ family protein [Candidatus Binatia bacterium]
MEPNAVSKRVVEFYQLATTKPLLNIPDTTAFQFDFAWVCDHLPHRPPFLFIDGVQAIQNGILCARFDVDKRPDHFVGHFPRVPRWPGVIQIEAMAQAALMLYLFSSRETRSEVALTFVREARFRRAVLPGQAVQL